jgi:preprotein translocase subunit SecD
MSTLRDNWRIGMLVAFLLVSAVGIFLPMVGEAGSAVDSTETLGSADSVIEMESSVVDTQNTTVTVSDASSGPITLEGGSVTLEGGTSERIDNGASLTDGTVSITGGTLTVPNASAYNVSNPDDPATGVIEVASGTIETDGSTVSLTTSSTKLTNLQYGLDLDGGTRLRAPPIGVHAAEVPIGADADTTQIQRDLAQRLGVDVTDTNVFVPEGANSVHVEIYDESVTPEELGQALDALGYGVSGENLQSGVTDDTREEVVNTLQEKINRGGLSGGTVTETASGDQNFIIVEVPGATRPEVVDLVGDRGVVEVVAEVRQSGNVSNTTVLTSEDFQNIGQTFRRQSDGSPAVQVTLTDEGARQFSQRLQQLGFTSGVGPGNCVRTAGGSQGGESYCLLTMLDGEIIQPNSLSPSFARSLNDGTWVRDPSFTIGAQSMGQAQNVKVSLQVGSLPTGLDIDDRGTAYFVSASLAQEFKFLALVTGLVAWLGVTGMVFWRYRQPRVALPMLFTAIAEVFILLGFAAYIGLPLDLSHIAGLIAVIGTGVDDLIIIADEILQEGKVATGRIFQNRFRKAFWVIGAAAATTIIAMSPLAILSLGDLQGFAIITIVGVLIGVLITRPAYGDILRNLVLSEDQR